MNREGLVYSFFSNGPSVNIVHLARDELAADVKKLNVLAEEKHFRTVHNTI